MTDETRFQKGDKVIVRLVRWGDNQQVFRLGTVLGDSKMNAGYFVEMYEDYDGEHVRGQGATRAPKVWGVTFYDVAPYNERVLEALEQAVQMMDTGRDVIRKNFRWGKPAGWGPGDLTHIIG